MLHVLLDETNNRSCVFCNGYLSMAFVCVIRIFAFQNTIKHSWIIKTVIQLETPRYLRSANKSIKRHVRGYKSQDCKLTNAKLYLNWDYSYVDLNLDFDKNRCTILYNIYIRVFAKPTMDTSISNRVSSLCLFYVMAHS